MDIFSPVLKKYSLLFPHLQLPVIIEHENCFKVFIFDIELEISGPSELDNLIEQVKEKMIFLYNERQQIELSRMSEKSRDIKNQTELKTINSVAQIKNNSVKQGKLSNDISNTKISARGKMKIKNLQNNRYVPSFSEDVNENKSNILTEPIELFSEKITSYCHNRNIVYPEYVFEKSNGVYLCKALFLKEKFESRYAYDMTAAKEDASRLIYSYIKFLDTENCKRKCSVLGQNEENKPEARHNTNYSDLFNNTENDDSFDIGNFFKF